MKDLIRFENMKFWRGNKTTLVLVVFLAALIGMVAFNTAQDKGYWEIQREILDNEHVLILIEIRRVEAHLEAVEVNSPLDTETIEQVTSLNRFVRSQRLLNVRQQIMARNYSHGQASAAERIALWIERDEHLLAGLEEGHNFLNEVPEQVRQRLLVNRYLLEENIEPLHSPYEMTATNFIYRLTDYPWIFVILLALSLLTIDIFSGDIESGAYKVLYSQPFNRSKIYAVKYAVQLANSFFVISGLVFLVFGIVALLNGIGEINYPINYFSESFHGLITGSTSSAAADTLTFLPWSRYILIGLPLYTLLCCFVIALTGTGSLLLSNTANVLNAVFCMLVLDFLSRALFPNESTFHIFWPFTAAGLNGVLQGLYPLSGLGYLIMLGILTVTLFLTSMLVLKRRNLTGGFGA